MCVFCDVVAGAVSAEIVYEDDVSLAFLDHRPLFPGHTLLVPREHYETLTDLPAPLVEPFFTATKLLAGAVRVAMNAQGSSWRSTTWLVRASPICTRTSCPAIARMDSGGSSGLGTSTRTRPR